MMLWSPRLAIFIYVYGDEYGGLRPKTGMKKRERKKVEMTCYTDKKAGSKG